MSRQVEHLLNNWFVPKKLPVNQIFSESNHIFPLPSGSRHTLRSFWIDLQLAGAPNTFFLSFSTLQAFSQVVNDL